MFCTFVSPDLGPRMSSLPVLLGRVAQRLCLQGTHTPQGMFSYHKCQASQSDIEKGGLLLLHQFNNIPISWGLRAAELIPAHGGSCPEAAGNLHSKFSTQIGDIIYIYIYVCVCVGVCTYVFIYLFISPQRWPEPPSRASLGNTISN